MDANSIALRTTTGLLHHSEVVGGRDSIAEVFQLSEEHLRNEMEP